MKEKIQVFKLGGAFFEPKTIKAFFKFFAGQEVKRLYIVSAVKGVTRLLDNIFFVQKQKDISKSYKEKVVRLSLEEFTKIHLDLINGLFKEGEEEKIVKADFLQIHQWLYNVVSTKVVDERYHAQLLKFGELVSSSILTKYMNSIGIKSLLFNAGEYIVASVKNDDFCKAEVTYVKPFDKLFNSYSTLVTQGFIARDKFKQETALGYDGSDTSAAVFAVKLAEVFEDIEVKFFKDVRGVFEEDPKGKFFVNPNIYMSYGEYLAMVEKTGAFPVKPNAIIFLQEAGIKIYVRSYSDLESMGTVIYH